jgi:hypothetical protein
MSDNEIERIFRSLDRIEARLAALEKREASREGAEQARSLSRGQLIGWVMVIAAVVGAASAVASQVLNQF